MLTFGVKYIPYELLYEVQSVFTYRPSNTYLHHFFYKLFDNYYHYFIACNFASADHSYLLWISHT